MVRLAHLSVEALGYALHTNRELGLMLKRQKPLAVFSEFGGKFPPCVQRYLRLFDRHVHSGIFVRQDYIEPYKDGHSIHTVLIAQADQTWRIPAMIELRKHLGAWAVEYEREEGRLLGYEEWQTDLWIARRPPEMAEGAI
jgi:hypothetical protein